MNDSIATTSQEFWLKRALQKAHTVLAEGVTPLPDNHYQQRFAVEGVELQINEHGRQQAGRLSKYYSIISEGLICNLINQGLIFGPKAKAVKTNKYDDYINHIDLVVDLPEFQGRYLAIDVTYGTVMDKKVKRLRNEIKSGQLSELNYVNIEEKKKIPKIFLGLELNNLLKIGPLWVNQPERLSESGILGSLWLQIEQQLDGYENYAQYWHHHEAAVIYQELMSYLYPIFEQMRSKSNNIWKDKVSEAIIHEALKFGIRGHST